MFGKKKAETPALENKSEKPIPAFLKDDFPYKAVGNEIMDIDTIEPTVFYEIKCHTCEMSIRLLGKNIRSKYECLKKSGCVACGNKELIIKMVDMNKAPKITNQKENK